jgi:alcohol dehydrogenase class IV
MRFELATATRIVFGAGSLKETGDIARQYGHRALLVLGRAALRPAAVLDLLTNAGVECVPLHVEGEPTIEAVRAGVKEARRAGSQVVIGLGGGSAIDAAKAIAALLTNEGDPLDYLEVIGRGQTLIKPAAPFLALPTTAGTGAEVTRNAVLTSPEHRVKASLRNPHMLAKVALIDPDLLAGLPPPIIAASGLDALSQLVEPFVSCRANPLTDALCRDAIPRSVRALPRAYAGDLAPDVREDLALASLFGGLALANAGLGAVHGFAAALGGMFAAPHGALCAALLSPVMEGNIRALEQRAPKGEALARYGLIGRMLTGQESPWAAVDAIRSLTDRLGVPGLARHRVRSEDIPEIVERAAAASSMRGNPVVLTHEELAAVLARALE